MIFSLLEEVAHRRGVGVLIADGVMHDRRGKKGMGLAYATANRGGCYLQSIHEDALEADGPFPELGLEKAMGRKQLEGKAYLAKKMQDYFGSLADSLGLCKFPMNAWLPLTPKRVVKSAALATGWDMSLQELLETGERIFNLCRLSNVRENIHRTHNTLPVRLAEPLPEGASSGEKVSPGDLNTLLSEYYALRGWDDNGILSGRRLIQLGLDPEAFHIH